MTLHSRISSALLVSTTLGSALLLGACNSDGHAAFSGSGGGGGSSGGPGVASSDGTLSRTIDSAGDIVGGTPLASTGNAALGAVAPVAGSVDNTLNGVAKTSVQGQTLVGSSDPSSSQLLGVNVLSSSGQSTGTVGTATINQSASQPTGLLGVSATGNTVISGGSTPVVSVAAAPPQGSVATATVNAPQTGATTGTTGGLLNGGTLSTGGLLGGVLPTTGTTTTTTSTTGGP
jgi:hypothetical protein